MLAGLRKSLKVVCCKKTVFTVNAMVITEDLRDVTEHVHDVKVAVVCVMRDFDCVTEDLIAIMPEDDYVKE
jgi:hypothetical protein